MESGGSETVNNKKNNIWLQRSVLTLLLLLLVALAIVLFCWLFFLLVRAVAGAAVAALGVAGGAVVSAVTVNFANPSVHFPDVCTGIFV